MSWVIIHSTDLTDIGCDGFDKSYSYVSIPFVIANFVIFTLQIIIYRTNNTHYRWLLRIHCSLGSSTNHTLYSNQTQLDGVRRSYSRTFPSKLPTVRQFAAVFTWTDTILWLCYKLPSSFGNTWAIGFPWEALAPRSQSITLPLASPA